MKLMFKAAIFSCLIICCFALVAVGQEKQEDVKVRLRLLPVTVVQPDGGPMKGLTADDFELLVDGKPVPIRNVDEYDYGVLRYKQRRGEPVTYESADLPARRFILVFDLLSSGVKGYQEEASATESILPMRGATTREAQGQQPDVERNRGIRMSKNAALQWLEDDMLPTDEVAVVEYFLGARMLQPYTSNKEFLKNAIEGISYPQDVVGMDMGDPFADLAGPSNAKFSRTEIQISQMSKAYLGFYERMGELLASLPGTKNIIMFSEGVAIHHQNTGLSLLPELKRATQTLASSNSRVASVSIAGLDRARGSNQDDFLYQMANETGGTYYPGRAMVKNALREATESFDHFYEIFFSPDPRESSEFHNVEVRIKNKQAKITAPPGYLGERNYDQLTGAQRDIHILQGFWQPLYNEIGSEMSWSALPYGNGRTALHIRSFIPPEMLVEKNRKEFEAYLAIGRDGEKYDDARWEVDSKTTESGAVQLDFLLPLPEGHSSFQFVVMDREDGKRAYMMDGVEIGKLGKGISMSPIYISKPEAGPAEVEVKETQKPELLTGPIPKAVRDLVSKQKLLDPVGGETVAISFIFNGPDFEQAAVEFSRDEDKQVIEATDIKQVPLEDGVRLVSFTVTLPQWEVGELSLKPLIASNGKVYALVPTKLTIN